MRPGFEFLCIPVKRRAFSWLCELCGSENRDCPQDCSVRERTLSRSFLSDLDKLLLCSLPPVPIQEGFLLSLAGKQPGLHWDSDWLQKAAAEVKLIVPHDNESNSIPISFDHLEDQDSRGSPWIAHNTVYTVGVHTVGTPPMNWTELPAWWHHRQL